MGFSAGSPGGGWFSVNSDNNQYQYNPEGQDRGAVVRGDLLLSPYLMFCSKPNSTNPQQVSPFHLLENAQPTWGDQGSQAQSPSLKRFVITTSPVNYLDEQGQSGHFYNPNTLLLNLDTAHLYTTKVDPRGESNIENIGVPWSQPAITGDKETCEGFYHQEQGLQNTSFPVRGLPVQFRKVFFKGEPYTAGSGCLEPDKEGCNGYYAHFLCSAPVQNNCTGTDAKALCENSRDENWNYLDGTESSWESFDIGCSAGCEVGFSAVSGTGALSDSYGSPNYETLNSGDGFRLSGACNNFLAFSGKGVSLSQVQFNDLEDNELSGVYASIVEIEQCEGFSHISGTGSLLEENYSLKNSGDFALSGGCENYLVFSGDGWETKQIKFNDDESLDELSGKFATVISLDASGGGCPASFSSLSGWEGLVDEGDPIYTVESSGSFLLSGECDNILIFSGANTRQEQIAFNDESDFSGKYGTLVKINQCAGFSHISGSYSLLDDSDFEYINSPKKVRDKENSFEITGQCDYLVFSGNSVSTSQIQFDETAEAGDLSGKFASVISIDACSTGFNRVGGSGILYGEPYVVTDYLTAAQNTVIDLKGGCSNIVVFSGGCDSINVKQIKYTNSASTALTGKYATVISLFDDFQTTGVGLCQPDGTIISGDILFRPHP